MQSLIYLMAITLVMYNIDVFKLFSIYIYINLIAKENPAVMQGVIITDN
jgi:hypothetical protein